MHNVGQEHYSTRSASALIRLVAAAQVGKATIIRRLPTIVAVLVLGFVLAGDAVAQQPGFFDVKSVIQDVQKRYRLSQADLQFIAPLIQQDNADLLVIYERCGGSEPDYSPVLWDMIIEQRTAFEARANTKLSSRQASALRQARRSLETRILTRIVDDYVDFLVVYLELEALEVEAIEHLFQKERRAKQLLVLKYLDKPDVLAKELDAVTDRTEYWLARILSADQLRQYQSLSEPAPTFVG